MTYIKDFDKAKIQTLLSENQKITILGHHNPDGDAVSGCTALFEVFRQLNKDVQLVMPSKISEAIKNIPNVEHIVFHEKDKEKAEKIFAETQVLFCIDFNAYKRAGDVLSPVLQACKAFKIMIDHHPQPEMCADIIISDTSVSSASELVYEVITELGWTNHVNQKVAESLFTGIMTDTNNFSVNCSRARTFEIAAHLLAKGIDRERIYEQVFNNYTEGRLRFTGYFLDKKMIIDHDLKISVATFSKREQDDYGFKHGDHEGLVNMPLSISGVEVSILALEHDDFLKLSFRSKGAVDVNVFARKFFNGGGHVRAAGGKLYKVKPHPATQFLIEKFAEYIKSEII